MRKQETINGILLDLHESDEQPIGPVETNSIRCRALRIRRRIGLNLVHAELPISAMPLDHSKERAEA